MNHPVYTHIPSLDPHARRPGTSYTLDEKLTYTALPYRQAGATVGMHLDDLRQAGYVGLLKAAARYDPQRGIAFWSYAEHRVRGAMRDAIRVYDWASQAHRRRSPDFRVVAAAEEGDEMASDSAGVEALMMQSRLRLAIRRLPRPQQQVLALRYWEGWPVAKIGAYLGLSQARISQIHTCAVRTLRRLLTRLEDAT